MAPPGFHHAQAHPQNTLAKAQCIGWEWSDTPVRMGPGKATCLQRYWLTHDLGD